MKWMTNQVSQKRIEEASIKWIDRQITEKIKMPLKLIKMYEIFLQVLECDITFNLFQ